MIEGFQKAVATMNDTHAPSIKSAGINYRMDQCAKHLRNLWSFDRDKNSSTFFESVVYLATYVILKSGKNTVDVITSVSFDDIVNSYPAEMQDFVSYLLKTYCSVVSDLESKEQFDIYRNCNRYGCLSKIMTYERII